MIDVTSRRRTQPAPPHVMCGALTEPDRDADRAWLLLRDDEVRPTVLTARNHTWSSPWERGPEA